MRPSSLLVTCCTLAVVSFVARSTAAFTLLTSKSGARVRWAAESIEVVADASIDEIGPGAMDAVIASFATWGTVDGSGAPEIVVQRGTADAVGYTPGQDNHSTIRFASNGYDPAGDALAITVVSYADDGTILDVDVVINGGPSRPFAVLPDDAAVQDPGTGRYDVQNVVTHEAGHCLGLGEELELVDDTMYITSARGETKKRDLAPDDQAGLFALYTARGQPATIACAASPGPARGGETTAAAVVAFALCARRRRTTAQSLRRGCP